MPNTTTASSRCVETESLDRDRSTTGLSLSDEAISSAENILQEALSIFRTGLSRAIRRIDITAVGPIAREVMGALGTTRMTVDVSWRESSGLELPESLGREILARKHSLRLLVHRDTTRTLAAGQKLRRLVEEGASIRLSPAFVPNLVALGPGTGVIQAGDGADEPGALLLQNAQIVEMLRRLHSALWEQAAEAAPPGPPLPTLRPPVAGRIDADPIQRQVLGLLCSGVKDEAAARQMGVSVRTYRRYVARILKTLDVTSRFQAGLKAAELGLAGPRSRRAMDGEKAS